MEGLLQKLINIGVRKTYQPWEINLTRRLNAITFISIANILLSIIFLNYLGYKYFNSELIFAILTLPIVIILNKYKNYTWAIYFYFINGFLFFIPITLKMGIDSYIILFYFPMIIGMMHLLGRKETIKQLFILSGLCFLTIITIALGFKFQFYTLFINASNLKGISIIIIILGFTSTIFVTLFLVSDFIRQENTIKKVLQEKEILLAEVNHRVKNNLSIINGLLNIKIKNAVNQDVKLALEETKNRIFSMALIHQYILEGSNIIDLNFKEYIEKLVTEIKKTFENKLNVKLEFDTEKMEIDINNAVPLGLILNELITNSFKHAKNKEEELKINIKFKSNNNRIDLEVKDNGNGIKKEEMESENSIGLELIKALSEQINGQYSFENDSGLVFRLYFS